MPPYFISTLRRAINGRTRCSAPPSRTESFYLKIMSVQFSSILRTIILIVLFRCVVQRRFSTWHWAIITRKRRWRLLIGPHTQISLGPEVLWGLRELRAHARHFQPSQLTELSFRTFLLFRSPLAEAEGESVFVSSGRTHSQFALKLFALMQGNRQVACCCSHCSCAGGHTTFLQKALLQLGRKTNWTADMAKQSLLWAEFNSLIGRNLPL